MSADGQERSKGFDDTVTGGLSPFRGREAALSA
jgi:hypothetical protein